QGYKVNLVYVGIGSATLSALRVKQRVARGGHDIPKPDVMRRYGRSVAALPKALAIAHRAWVLDNTSDRRRMLLIREDGRTKYVSPALPAWTDGAIPAAVRAVTRSRHL
ncbi:hypothetical protein, partial [Azospirillum argentinense]|uniref:hypothetical protein n=1 Tax=Azospirillum argentinense TaxID=2970906 RepID=UPI003D81A577